MRSTLAALLVLGGLFAGCASDDHPDRARDDRHGDRHADRDRYNDAPVVRDDRDSWNRLHSDPVCGMTVNPKEAYTDYYDGSVYYFDTEECRRRFHDHPQAYLPGYERDRDRDRDRRVDGEPRPRDVK
jgi:YHS domain-containing protein